MEHRSCWTKFDSAIFDRGNYAERVYWVFFKAFDLFYDIVIPKLILYRSKGKHIRRIRNSITKKNKEENGSSYQVIWLTWLTDHYCRWESGIEKQWWKEKLMGLYR